MERPVTESSQWTLDVSVYHLDGFRHVVRAMVLSKRGGWQTCGQWVWTGVGIPEPLLNDVVARVDGLITEHLVTRYGIQLQLPRDRQEGRSTP
jgi:hypothetical protein